MPFWLGVNGFENRDVNRDRITSLSGAVSYQTTNLPPNSESTTNLSDSGLHVRMPWLDDSTGTPFTAPASGEFWCHFRFRASVFSAGHRIGVQRTAVEYIVFGLTTTGYVTLQIAGAVVATATVNPFVLDTWERIHIHVGGNLAADVINVYKDGNFGLPIITYTLIAGDQTSLGTVGLPNEFVAQAPTGAGNGIDDFLAWDPNDANAISFQKLGQIGIKATLVNGNGAEQQWTGGFGNIDERPASDADVVTATAVGDVSTYTKAALGSANLYGVKIYARTLRNDAVAGVNFRFKAIEGANTFDGPSMPAANPNGDLCHIMDLAADGTQWTVADYDSTRFGFEALT